MTNLKFEKIIAQINQQLKARYQSFKGSFFYGSRVKAKESIDSDYDLVLTFNQDMDWREKKEIYGIISDFEVENNILIDVHIYKLNDILDPMTPYRQNVKNDGIFYGI
ncbi:nucleotidyltransferase domain-containing protein [candidate division KSB1 bacterium]|nr:nucleotidyltransferase domain-containing protein [candidate division KSB1 bacterium]